MAAQAEQSQPTAQLNTTPSHPSAMAAQLTSSTLPPSDTPLPTPIIKTSRLLLRSMHPQDVTSMHKACQPPSITKYMSLAFAYPYTLTHAQNWVAMNLKDNLPNYVITEHSTPEVVIGGIGLKPGTDVQSHTAEVGYWVAEEHWGKGYISEALSALTDYVFEGKHPGGYKRLFAGVFSGNDASMRCLQKCGYLAEGVLKGHVEKHGVIRDVHMFGLTKWDWEERRRQREGE